MKKLVVSILVGFMFNLVFMVIMGFAIKYQVSINKTLENRFQYLENTVKEKGMDIGEYPYRAGQIIWRDDVGKLVETVFWQKFTLEDIQAREGEFIKIQDKWILRKYVIFYEDRYEKEKERIEDILYKNMKKAVPLNYWW